MKNKILATLLALSLALSLAACGSKNETPADNTAADDAQTEQPADTQETVTLNVAASPTPHAEILQQCVPILAEQGIDLQIHEYSDYVVPNTAVEDGEEDANYFQHIPYLDDFNTTRGTHLVSVTGVHIEPMGIYAGKSASLDELPDGATVAVPNDATNEGRALLLLEKQGLIKLADDSNLSSTPKDIVENPKNLTFTEVEAATVPSIVSEVDMMLGTVAASQPKKEKKVEYVPDSTNYTIAGTQATYTIKPGETLTRVALRFYGTKALYPYIVKHNPDVIKKPDNVPAGTTIKIPKLVKKQ